MYYLYKELANAACALSIIQYNDVMATILKAWRQIENPTPSTAYLIEEQSNTAKLNPDPIRNDGALGFLPRDASAERGNATVSRLSVRPSVCPWRLGISNT